MHASVSSFICHARTHRPSEMEDPTYAKIETDYFSKDEYEKDLGFFPTKRWFQWVDLYRGLPACLPACRSAGGKYNPSHEPIRSLDSAGLKYNAWHGPIRSLDTAVLGDH